MERKISQGYYFFFLVLNDNSEYMNNNYFDCIQAINLFSFTFMLFLLSVVAFLAGYNTSPHPPNPLKLSPNIL